MCYKEERNPILLIQSCCFYVREWLEGLDDFFWSGEQLWRRYELWRHRQYNLPPRRTCWHMIGWDPVTQIYPKDNTLRKRTDIYLSIYYLFFYLINAICEGRDRLRLRPWQRDVQLGVSCVAMARDSQWESTWDRWCREREETGVGCSIWDCWWRQKRIEEEDDIPTIRDSIDDVSQLNSNCPRILGSVLLWTNSFSI